MNKPQIISLSQSIPTCDFSSFAGVDEAGRGALAGPVVVSAVVVRRHQKIAGCLDSKVLSQKHREALVDDIKNQVLAWSIEYASIEEIKKFNVLKATLRAMTRAVKCLTAIPGMVLVDGNQLPESIDQPCYAVISGDSRVNAISAASILAKVVRDDEMCNLHSHYPQYGFNSHKGYGTKNHLSALNHYGQCPIHRKGWKSVQHYSKQRKLNLSTTSID